MPALDGAEPPPANAAALIANALAMARHGYGVVLVNGKRPIGEDWNLKATTDAAAIAELLANNPGHNLGIIPPPGVCILDIDNKPQKDGRRNVGDESLAKYSGGSALVSPLTSLTGSGNNSRHMHFRVNPSRELARMPAGKGGCMEIIKPGKHQGLLPGSIHPEMGEAYAWMPGHGIAEFAGVQSLPWAPEWFYKPPEPTRKPYEAKAHAKGKGGKRAQGYLSALLDGAARDLATGAKRNSTLNEKAMYLSHFAHFGVYDDNDAWMALRAACDANGELAEQGEKACHGTFESGWKAGIGDPWPLPENGAQPNWKHMGGAEAGGRHDGEAREEASSQNANADDGGQKPRRFKLQYFNQITVNTSPAYLIKGIIPRESLIIVWGPPKNGKSFKVYDIAMSIARGVEYRGLKVRQGAVVYVAAEGGNAFSRRVEAYRQRHLAEDCDPIPFYLLADRLGLAADVQELIADIRAQVGTDIPAAVILDTLNRTIEGSESNDQDMGSYIKAADALKEAFGCAVVIVHHCGLDGTRPRGHTSLFGACDAQIAIKRDDTGLITLTVEHMKDGPEGETVASRLVPVEIGQDDDGDEMSSCVVIASDEKPAQDPVAKLAAGPKRVLAALKDAISQKGKVPVPLGVEREHDPDQLSNHIPAGAATVNPEVWREYFYAKSGDADAAAKRQAFNRGRNALADLNLIGSWQDHVWIVRPSQGE